MTNKVGPRLEPALKSSLAPVLRADGFQGTGRRFFAYSNGWLRLLNVQGSRYGGSFTINLAIHFASAPDLLGNTADPAKMTEAHCEFRRRLSESGADMWWHHESTTESILEAVQSATQTYVTFGRAYFSSAIAALDAMTPEGYLANKVDLQGFHSGKPRLGLALARVRRLQGDHHQSQRFAQYALQSLEVAVAWKAELEALADDA
jgi:hypothetical protein